MTTLFRGSAIIQESEKYINQRSPETLRYFERPFVNAIHPIWECFGEIKSPSVKSIFKLNHPSFRF